MFIATMVSSLGLALALAVPSAPVDAERASVSGVVKDASGALVADAQVSLLDGRQAVVRSVRTDAGGTFALTDLIPGSYLVVASVPGQPPRRIAVSLGPGSSRLEIVAGAVRLAEEVTVTATPGRVDDEANVSQPVNLIGADAVSQRAKAVVAQVAAEEVGVHLQRTSPTMAGIFVRGLTGNKVNVFVDGVRYSTSAARGGVSTFLDLVEPATLEGVEILRGPSSAQYGSDAIGGSVQFLTRQPPLSPDRPRLDGWYGASFGSADTSLGSDLTLAWGSRTFGLLGTIAGRRVNTLRPGQGRDSHNAVTRFFGVDSDVAIGDRLPDTAFTQYGGSLKARWAPSEGSQLLASYTRSQQDGGKRYDQLLGGDGNLVADLRNLMLDRFTLKYDRFGLGFFDQATLAYSYTAQREERVNQGGSGNARASINHEYEKTRAHGGQASLAKQWGSHSLALGGDFYHERVTAPSFGVNPATEVVTTRRGRVPDQALYQWGGAYLQDTWEAVSSRLWLQGNLRWNGAAYESKAADGPLVNGRPLWPDDSLSTSSLTFRAGAVVSLTEALRLSANLGRGFRAPHITDLGTLGLTGSGFEIAAPDVAGLGAMVGTTAGRDAVSTGDAVQQLGPETSLSWEIGLRYYRPRFRTEFVAFLNDVNDNMQKQALILPPGALGTLLGDQRVSLQLPSGVVFVPASSNPVLVRANFDQVRIWGIEHTLSARVSSAWTVSSVFTYLHAEDRKTGRPPNVEGGTPAPDGWLKIRWQPEGGRVWIEPYLHAAARQDRLSSLDVEDRRTGATRSRSSIASFFGNGARARGLIGPGADGLPGNADDVLLATGETLAQIQERVLGPGGAAAPLFSAVPGYVTFGVRGGLRLGTRHEVLVDVENVFDRNYRGISWGMDAPGRGIYLRYSARF